MSVSELLTRVEGEGRVEIVYKDGVVKDVRICISEAPRFFEAIVIGSKPINVPDIVSRICGICGVSHVLAAVKAFENGLGIEIDERIERFRKVLHLIERVKSHALHSYIMHLPDLLGMNSIIDLSNRNPNVFRSICRFIVSVRKLMEIMGGRFHNVVNLRLGGVYRYPTHGDIRAALKLVKDLEDCFSVIADLILSLEIPRINHPKLNLVCIASDRGYPHSGSTLIVELDGATEVIRVEEFEKKFIEYQVEYSTALMYRLWNGLHYCVGPIARFNLFNHELPSETRELLRSYGWSSRVDDVHESVVARLAEIHAALMEIKNFLEDYKELRIPKATSLRLGPGTYRSLIEAPRGVLYHRYDVDERGRISRANIVTPTAQNMCVATNLLKHVLLNKRVGMRMALDIAQKIVRSFDPCISCSVHVVNMS